MGPVGLAKTFCLLQTSGYGRRVFMVQRVSVSGEMASLNSPGAAAQKWKRRRAEYLLHAGRLSEIRAEGLEHALGFEPGELEDNRDTAQIHMLRSRAKILRKQRARAN
jgi:hypothetical protein